MSMFHSFLLYLFDARALANTIPLHTLPIFLICTIFCESKKELHHIDIK